MTTDPLSDVVSAQYERWVYPQPIVDLPGWLQSNWQWFDPSHSHLMFWPDRDYWPGMQILVAGCGTNQAAVLAYTNPQACVVAIDVSQSSLDNHASLKRKYNLKNLDLYRLPIEEVSSLQREFDLIISTGVLHHLADPLKGLVCLSQCLRQDGVMALMLYACYGRLGVEMLQGVFRDLGLSQNENSLELVKEAISLLPNDHPVQSYIQMAPDLAYDAGLVDTFLHGRDRSYSVDGCFELVEGAGLEFQNFFLRAPYEIPLGLNGRFVSSLAAASDRQRWAMMERLNFRNGCHFFTACRADRAPQTYRIDLGSASARHYVPVFRFRCYIEGRRMIRPNWQMELDDFQAAILGCVDGALSIEQIIAKAANLPTVAGRGEDLTRRVMELMTLMWQLDFISIKFGQV